MAFASSASCPTGHLPRNSCTQTLSSGTICTCHSLRSLAISVTVSSVQIIFQCILMFSWWTILARESGPGGLQCTRSQKSSAPQLYFCGPKIHSNTEVAWHVLKLIFTILFHSFYFSIFLNMLNWSVWVYSLKFKLCLLDLYTASLICTRNITVVFQEFCQPGKHNSELVPSGTRSLRPIKLSTVPDCSSETKHQMNESSTHQVSSVLQTCWNPLPLSLGWCFWWSIPPTPPL